jgi:hypothetical protein
VVFSKSGAPDIEMLGYYVHHMPFIPLIPAAINSLHSVVPRPLPIFPIAHHPELLSLDQTTEIHQVLRLVALARHMSVPTPEDFCVSIFHLFHEMIADNWNHGGTPVFPGLHVLDAVSRTPWHILSCHPNPASLVLLSKIYKGLPPLIHHQDIEKCYDCLIAKTHKAARGHAPGFVATSVGQGLALDVGFMFQRSKNAARAKRLLGISGNNTYCVVYDFKSEVLFGVTMRGKTITITWLNVLLTRITPHDCPGCIVHLDLGGKTGKNPEIQALFLKHGYILEPTGAGASSQNGFDERPHQTIGDTVCTMLLGPKLPQVLGICFLFLFAHTCGPAPWQEFYFSVPEYHRSPP